LENKAPDLPPVPGLYSEISRDREYVWHTQSSLGIGLLNGQVLGQVERRHRSREFVSWLKMVDALYLDDIKNTNFS
jgi:hypothetical protein